MTKRRNVGLILQQVGVGWQVAVATTNPAVCKHLSATNQDPKSLAGEVAEYVADEGLSTQVAILLDSKSSLAVKFTMDGPAELRDRRVMGYRVEERLPLAAEDFVADYVNHGNEVLAIATPTRELLSVVTALEEQGLHVDTIAPTALLALQSFVREHGKPDGDIVIWQDDQSLELFRYGRQLTDWRHLPASTSAVQQQFGATLLRLGAPPSVSMIGVEAAFRDAIESAEQINVELIDAESLNEHARRGAAAALAGRVKPWFELHRDQLVAGDPYRAFRRERQWCYAALAMLLLATAFFFWMRGRQYEHHVATIQEEQRDLYKQVLPNTRIPGAVLSRLRSERKKLLGARGKDAAVEQPPSALNVLGELVMGLPDAVRLQVQQLRVEDGKVYLDVDVRSVGKAGELADALEQRGFSIDPPTTEQYDADRVSVRINGILSSTRPETKQ